MCFAVAFTVENKGDQSFMTTRDVSAGEVTVGLFGFHSEFTTTEMIALVKWRRILQKQLTPFELLLATMTPELPCPEQQESTAQPLTLVLSITLQLRVVWSPFTRHLAQLRLRPDHRPSLLLRRQTRARTPARHPTPTRPRRCIGRKRGHIHAQPRHARVRRGGS